MGCCVRGGYYANESTVVARRSAIRRHDNGLSVHAYMPHACTIIHVFARYCVVHVHCSYMNHMHTRSCSVYYYDIATMVCICSIV